MRTLLAFLYRYHFVFVFILAQLICFWLMMQGKTYQGSLLINSSNTLAANVYQVEANTVEYFSLKKENERLAKENNVLRNFLRSNYIAIPAKPSEINDTIYKQQYQFLNAKVVNASVNNRSNYLTLNIGANDGVKRDMAVFNSLGIVGIVKDVSANFSSVMSLLHKNITINCKLKRDGSFGPLIWDGRDYQRCLLTDIPIHSKIKIGDTVVTSELSGVFPEGIMAGVIESFERRQNEQFYTSVVKLSVDMKKLNHVSVVINKYKAEKDSLEMKSQKQSDK